MAASIPILDLTIFDSHNINLLVIGDSSFYPVDWSIVTPTVQITVPGYGPKTISFTEKTVNIYNSNDLAITCDVDICDLVPLPDGIYTIKYAIAPAYTYNVTKTWLRVDSLYKKFDDKFLNISMFTCDGALEKTRKQEIDEIEYYIQGAIAAGNRCSTTLAMELYRKAETLLNRFVPNCL